MVEIYDNEQIFLIYEPIFYKNRIEFCTLRLFLVWLQKHKNISIYAPSLFGGSISIQMVYSREHIRSIFIWIAFFCHLAIAYIAYKNLVMATVILFGFHTLFYAISLMHALNDVS